MLIRNPVSWTADQAKLTASAAKSAGHMFFHTVDANVPRPEVRRISLSDVGDALSEGFADFRAYRTDVLFIFLVYPLAGLVLAHMTYSQGMLPLLFPLISGFALIGPFAATGIYEMSRRLERGKPVSWVDAFGVFGSPSFAAIIKLGLALTGIFLLWLGVAMGIYRLTFGDVTPASLSSFLNEAFTTAHGWALIGLGVGAGFLFALVVLSTSVISFPLLLDRRVSVWTAVRTSVRAVTLNPLAMLAWGAIVAGALALGAIPALIGLVVAMPVLGHATWRLYRKVVA